MREKFLPFSVPDITEVEISEVIETLKSGWITTGPRVKQFEKEFAEYVGAKHAIAVNSGTSALHLALEAVGVKAGDEVIVPTLTFAATAEVVRYFGATPVLVDSYPDDFQIDPERVQNAITGKTRAIIPVHYAGCPCDMDAIIRIARANGVHVIEDAAHALPTLYRGRMVGTIGDITAFSFYATKPITTAEGGMITTENDEYADRMRIMSLHGISRDAWKRYTAGGSWYYEVLYPGYKYNMTDISASLGIHQLRRCEDMYQRRKRCAELYTELLSETPQVVCPEEKADTQHAWHLYVIRLKLERLKIDRSAFIEELRKRNIGTSVHFIPLHLHPYYRLTYNYKPDDFPNAIYLYERIVSLPIYSKMTEDDVSYVAECVKEVLRQNSR